jgi:putative endonuclease
MRIHQYFVNILTNFHNTVLYIGVTGDLKRRLLQHRQAFLNSFSKKYKTFKLVYYEVFENINEAIAREKQLKGGSRQQKIDLINRANSEWKDLTGVL